MLGPVRFSQLLAAVSCFGAVLVLVLMMFRQHDPEKLFVNVRAAQLAEEEAEAETKDCGCGSEEKTEETEEAEETTEEENNG
jgi:hypothetical protein